MGKWTKWILSFFNKYRYVKPVLVIKDTGFSSFPLYYWTQEEQYAVK